MLNCPYCGTSTAGDFNFCGHCYKQVKCLNLDCQSILLPDKPICLKCGKPVGSVASDSAAPNTYVRDVRQTKNTYSERTEARGTNEAFGFVASIVLGQMPSRPPRPIVTNPGNNHPQNGKQIGQLALGIEALIEEEKPLDEVVQVDAPQKATGFARFFNKTGEKELTAIISDYKGTSKKQQQVRFILLFVGGYEEYFSTPTPSKEIIVAAAHRGGLYDGNFSRYIGQMTKYMVCANGTFTLNPAGRAEANKIANEVDDTNKQGIDWNSGTKSPRKGSRSSKEEQALIKSWVELEVDLGRIDVKTLGALQQAMLALWSLTTFLKVVRAVKPMLAYMYLTQKYQTVPGKPKSFSSALAHERNNKIFGHNAASEYYLTSEAEKQVETWRAGKSTSVGNETEEDDDE